MLPVPSRTVACTSGRMPLRRTGRLAIDRTSTATVACSPARSAATVRACRESAGRCSSSSPTVCTPRARIACATRPRGSTRGWSRRLGRTQRSGAASISLRRNGGPPKPRTVARAAWADAVSGGWLAACALAMCCILISLAVIPALSGVRRCDSRRAALLLGGEQPPVGGLSALAQLELDAGARDALDLRQLQRRVLSREHADQLRRRSAVGRGEPRQHRCQRVRRIAPGQHLLLDEAHGLPAAKA